MYLIYLYIFFTIYSTVPALVCCLLAVTKLQFPIKFLKPPGGNLAYTGILDGGAQHLPISKPLTCYPQHLNQSNPRLKDAAGVIFVSTHSSSTK